MELNQELQEIRDVAFLYCPLAPQTRDLIIEEQFNVIKPNAIIVNEASGAAIDGIILVKALQKKLCGATTRETVIRCFSVGYNNILRKMKGEELINQVNK